MRAAFRRLFAPHSHKLAEMNESLVRGDAEGSVNVRSWVVWHQCLFSASEQVDQVLLPEPGSGVLSVAARVDLPRRSARAVPCVGRRCDAVRRGGLRSDVAGDPTAPPARAGGAATVGADAAGTRLSRLPARRTPPSTPSAGGSGMRPCDHMPDAALAPRSVGPGAIAGRRSPPSTCSHERRRDRRDDQSGSVRFRRSRPCRDSARPGHGHHRRSDCVAHTAGRLTVRAAQDEHHRASPEGALRCASRQRSSGRRFFVRPQAVLLDV